MICTGAGDEYLYATLSLQPRGPNLLQPNLWLNQATGFTELYSANNVTCQQEAANQEPLCVLFNVSAGTVSMQVRGLLIDACINRVGYEAKTRMCILRRRIETLWVLSWTWRVKCFLHMLHCMHVCNASSRSGLLIEDRDKFLLFI